METEVTALASTYKHFQIEKRRTPTLHHCAIGYLSPLHPDIPVGIVAANMLSGASFGADEWGYLFPKSSDVEPVRIHECEELYEPQLVEVVYTTDGPVTYLVAPRVDTRSQPWLTHLYRRPHPNYEIDPTYFPSDAACILAAEDEIYSFERDYVSGLLHYITRHIAAFRFWRYGDIGCWPLPEASHFPLDALLTIPKTAPCHCQRQSTYQECCYPLDRERLFKAMRRGRPLARRLQASFTGQLKVG